MDMISPSIAALTPSLTLKVTNRAKAMKASGEEVYGLAGGEPEMDTPENIKQAAIAALNNGATKYTPSAGLPALRQAIAEKLKRENNLEYDFTQITVGAGAKHACFNAIMATVSEGDEVIIPAPYWVSYPEMVRMCGGIPVIVETTAENGWKLTAEQFEEAMTPRTKMVILTTPNNPTGSVYSEEELRALGEVALSEDILILADEIYEHLVYGGHQARQHRLPQSGTVRPDHHHQRLFQGLRHDRMAPGLFRSPGCHCQGHPDDSGPHHFQRLHVRPVWRH